MVGCSPAMQRMFAQIERVALSDAPVLILGETGTGKELIARAIHDGGARRRGPYVPINCAALPRDLIESELFGYQRGAFSGALADHAGLLRAADGGTVLLDEITEMGPELQAKLLRVLQEGTVRPVGSVTEIPIDVRFVASSNRDLDSALRGGLLRSDLYYRLSVAVIVVPPLRDRGDDIALLAEHYLTVLNRRYGVDSFEDMRGIAGSALDALVREAWPGNVRELFNILERAFIASPARQLDLDDLFPATCELPAPCAAAPPAGASTYAESERVLIERTLQSAGGNKARAARELGISRKRLYARLAKYSL